MQIKPSDAYKYLGKLIYIIRFASNNIKNDVICQFGILHSTLVNRAISLRVADRNICIEDINKIIAIFDNFDEYLAYAEYKVPELLEKSNDR